MCVHFPSPSDGFNCGPDFAARNQKGQPHGIVLHLF